MKRNKSRTKSKTDDQAKRKQELIAAILDARQLSIVAGGTEAWPCDCAGDEDPPP